MAEEHSTEAGDTQPEVELWELECARKVARAFRRHERDDLYAELAIKVLALKRKKPPGVREWARYLPWILRKKALTIVARWRKREDRETGSLASPERVTGPPVESTASKSEIPLPFDQLTSAERRLVEALIETNDNHTAAARLLGVHRNTIPRQIARMRNRFAKCPIRNVTVATNVRAPPRRPAVRLTLAERRTLVQRLVAKTVPPRDAFKAHLILALADGKGASEIMTTLKTTRPTIDRWKRRFREHRLAGLEHRHEGRQRSKELELKISTYLRLAGRGASASCRELARRFKMSKSTVQRLLAARAGSKGRNPRSATGAS